MLKVSLRVSLRVPSRVPFTVHLKIPLKATSKGPLVRKYKFRRLGFSVGSSEVAFQSFFRIGVICL